MNTNCIKSRFGTSWHQGFQKALTLLFPRVTAPNDGDVSTALQRFKQAGPLNCEDFVAMYLEAHKGGIRFQEDQEVSKISLN